MHPVCGWHPQRNYRMISDISTLVIIRATYRSKKKVDRRSTNCALWLRGREVAGHGYKQIPSSCKLRHPLTSNFVLSVITVSAPLRFRLSPSRALSNQRFDDNTARRPSVSKLRINLWRHYFHFRFVIKFSRHEGTSSFIAYALCFT